jgi:hypothetical protein
MKRMALVSIVLAFWIGFPVADAVLADTDGIIEGTIGILSRDGKIVHGDWIRVMLVTRETGDLLSVAQLPEEKYRRWEAVNSLHSDFYVKISRQLSDPEFVVATTLTTEDGTFKFSGIAAGRYFVVVTFPSEIDGSKVAWQVPVAAEAGKIASIALTEVNILFPVHRR